MSFSEMMQQAIRIRTTTDATLRTEFDARPAFLQTSMFATQEVEEARTMGLEERLSACTAMKEKGNKGMREGQAGEACHTYEQALAILWYLDNRNPDWKKSGIKDEDITEVNFSPVEADDKVRVRNVKVALLLNIARAYFERKDFETSRKACSVALALNPSTPKALYWRAKTLVTPASAGGFETDEAIRDLARAADLDPGNKAVRGVLAKLRAEKAQQRNTDRATFAGLFSRGTVCDDGVREPERGHHPGDGEGRIDGHGDSERDSLDGSFETGAAGRKSHAAAPGRGRRPKDESTWTRKEIEERSKQLEMLARECEEQGLEEEAADYRKRVEGVGDALALIDRAQAAETKAEANDGLYPDDWKCDPGEDWASPTPTMRKRAEAHELDLANPNVLEFLRKMQDVECLQEDDGGKIPRLGPRQIRWGENEETWSEAFCDGAVRCMGRDELIKLMKHGHARAFLEKLSLKELRNLGSSQVCGQSKPVKRRRHRSPGKLAWTLSFAIAVGMFVFKALKIGLFTALSSGDRPTPSGANMLRRRRHGMNSSLDRGAGRRTGRTGRTNIEALGVTKDEPAGTPGLDEKREMSGDGEL